MPISGAYCEITDVEVLVGDVIGNTADDAPNQFGTSTRPSLVQATSLIQRVASRINVRLRNAYYKAPAEVQSGDTWTMEYIGHANACGAAALVLGTLPMESYFGANEEGSRSNSRKHYYESMLEELLHSIDRQRLIGLVSTGPNAPLEYFTIGSGSYKPSFTRDMKL